MAPAYFNCHTHRKAQIRDEFIIRNAFLPKTLPKANYPLSIGLHPWFASRMTPEEGHQRLRELASDEHVVAIGETGLDKLHQHYDLQKQHLMAHHEIACTFGLPLIIHNVKSSHELLRLIPASDNKVILHGFTGSLDTFKQFAKKTDTYISLGKSLMSPSEKIIETVRKVPIEKVLMETDSADVSIKEVYQAFSNCRNISLEQAAEQIRNNFNAAFPRTLQFQL